MRGSVCTDFGTYDELFDYQHGYNARAGSGWVIIDLCTHKPSNTIFRTDVLVDSTHRDVLAGSSPSSIPSILPYEPHFRIRLEDQTGGPKRSLESSSSCVMRLSPGRAARPRKEKNPNKNGDKLRE